MKHARTESGNVFFLILLGIVLFAAFTSVVMRSSQNGGSGNPDQDKLDATQIIQYGATLKSAVDGLRQNGISESEISFANADVAGYGTVDTAPTKEVFNTNGGAITYEIPNTRWLDSTYSAQSGYGTWYFTSRNMVRDIGTPIGSDCAADSCTELTAILAFIKRDVCLQINKQLGLGTTIPTDSFTFNSDGAKFTGSFSFGSTIIDAGSILAGRQAGCIEGGAAPPDDTYHFYQVLIAR